MAKCIQERTILTRRHYLVLWCWWCDWNRHVMLVQLTKLADRLVAPTGTPLLRYKSDEGESRKSNNSIQVHRPLLLQLPLVPKTGNQVTSDWQWTIYFSSTACQVLLIILTSVALGTTLTTYSYVIACPSLSLYVASLSGVVLFFDVLSVSSE